MRPLRPQHRRRRRPPGRARPGSLPARSPALRSPRALASSSRCGYRWRWRSRRCPGARPSGAATLLSVAEELLVQAVALDDLAAHRLHAAVHGGVRLEDPAHLAALHDVARRFVEVLDVELRGDARVLVLGLDAERED